MADLLALVATILTSFLPILNKCLLRDSRPALVVWIINAASLPILGAGTLLLTQCSITPQRGSLSLACAVHIPRFDGLFVAALLASACWHSSIGTRNVSRCPHPVSGRRR
jgi:hypothetical protein